MPERYFYLGTDERVLLKARAAPSYALALALAPVVLASVLLAAALAARALLPRVAEALPEWAPWAGWAALVTIFALVAWRRAATSEYALTEERVYARVGKLVTRVHFTTHDKVTDIRYHQGPIHRMLGIADLTFATAGAEVRVAGVKDALALKAASERARDAFLRELLHEAPRAAAPVTAEHAPTAATAARPEAPALAPWAGPRPDYLQEGDTPVWYARPRPVSAVGALRSLLGIVPVLFFAGAMEPTRRALVIAAALGLLLVFIAVRLMQLRRVEYVATDKRVYGRRGLVGTTVSQLTYDKITDITYQQDVIGRVLGYGTVTVQTAGGNQAPIVMHGLADPLGAKETIERWRDAGARGG